jgi:Ca2+-binding EF-hand superfamily protein
LLVLAQWHYVNISSYGWIILVNLQSFYKHVINREQLIAMCRPTAQFVLFSFNFFVLRCFVLDEMDDTTTKDERMKHFNAFDSDQSGVIDFEQYLNVSIMRA